MACAWAKRAGWALEGDGVGDGDGRGVGVEQKVAVGVAVGGVGTLGRGGA